MPGTRRRQKNVGQDAIALLKKDHERVKALLNKLKSVLIIHKPHYWSPVERNNISLGYLINTNGIRTGYQKKKDD